MIEIFFFLKPNKKASLRIKLSKRDMLAYIQKNLKNRMSGWYAKSMSHGGKEIMIKSVAMAMPIYAMSCFKLTKTTCEKLSSVMADYWWNSMENKRKIYWIAWEKMCLPKAAGGLGFKDIQLFNQVLLAKQVWRILNAPDSLFSLFLKSRYFGNSQFLNVVAVNRHSFSWRSILF